MSKLKDLREQNHLTQEELAEKSGLSVRTIQRIESGIQPRGYTLKTLAKTFEVDESYILNLAPNNQDPIDVDTTLPVETINISYVKWINLSSIPLMFLPPLNILVPLFLMYQLKQKSAVVKQIISLQILWLIFAPIVFLFGIFLKLGGTFTLILMGGIFLSNILLILSNARSLDHSGVLRIKLKFSLL